VLASLEFSTIPCDPAADGAGGVGAGPELAAPLLVFSTVARDILINPIFLLMNHPSTVR
jgi:hypothetical protein